MIFEMAKDFHVCFVKKINDVECPFFGLVADKTSHNEIEQLVVKLKSYLMIESDLLKAKHYFSWVKSENDHKNSDFIEAIFEMAIICYSRPFADGEGRSFKIHGDQVFKKKTEFKGIHQQLRDLRNKFSAHSGGTLLEEVLVCVALNPPPKERAVLELYHGILRLAGHTDDFLNESIAAIDYIIEWLRPFKDELTNKILELVRANDLEILYKNAIYPEAIEKTVRKVIILK